jgi:biotin carboxylase
LSPFSNKHILFIGGGRQALPAIEKAKTLGARVSVADYDEKCPGFSLADHQLTCSTYDVSETVKKACQLHAIDPINGVLCVATDVPHTVAYVAEALGLPGLSPSIAELAVDKLAMKQCFKTFGVAIPWFSPVENAAELDAFRESGKRLVIKPIDSRGSRGVLLLEEKIDSKWAFETALKESPTSKVMVEQYLEGPQISSESVVVNGIVHTVGLSTRNYELLDKYAPYFIENGGELPATQDAKLIGNIDEQLQAAVDALNIKNGIVKGDLVITQGQTHILELALRLSGGYFCTHEIPYATGADSVLANLYLCLGLKPPSHAIERQWTRHIAQRYLFVPPGIVQRIDGLEEVKASNGVEFFDLWVKPGDAISHPTNSGCSVAVVIAKGASNEQAISLASQALNKLHVVVSNTN